ncbi:MAG: efflux RND transporter permease subunit [Thermoanaerobaculia bacterium]
MISRTLDALARLCLRHSKAIAIVAVLVAAISLVGASRLRFDPDLLNLIPQNNREVNEFRQVLNDLGTLDNHVVVMHLPRGAEIDTYDSLIESLAEGYRKSTRIEQVQYRIPNPLDFVELILPRALLFLSPEQLGLVEQKLSDEGIRQSVARNRTLLQTPQSFALKQLIQFDPFNLAPIFLEKFTSASGGFRIDASSGYYVSADHTMLLILTKPKRPAQDVPFAKELLAEGAIIEARALRDFRKENPSAPLPKIEHTGGYQIAVGDADLIRSDVIVNVLTSFFGVLFVFLYGFRRFASLFYAAIPLAIGLAMTFGLAGVMYGELSSASAGFAALLAGLGIDFISVIYGRYVDERNRGATMAHALILAIRQTYPGVAIAALTTAATFYGFLATDFRGMTQLGFLTGTGILFFVLCVVFLLPALIVMSEHRPRKKAPRLYHHSFGSQRLVALALRAPKATIAIWIVATIVFGIFATKVRFSDNVQDLRAKGNEGVINQEKVTKKFGQSFEFMMYVIDGPSLPHVIERTHAFAKELKPLIDDGTVSSSQSIASFVPPETQQLAMIRALEEGRADRFDYQRIATTFRAALEDNGFRPEAYDDYLETFRQTLAPAEPISIGNLGNQQLLDFASRFVKRKPDGQWMSVTYIYPTGGRWPREVPPRLLALNDLHREEILTGINLVSGTLRRIVRADAIRSTVISLIAVSILLVISFRSFKMMLLSYVPLVAGSSLMFGAMALLKLEFNFMNVFVGLMLVGVATDYAVYMLQRFKEDPATFAEAAPETAKAVAMAALTTVVGYGSFALSHYPGLRSIGYASLFGVLFSGLAAVTLLPAILMLLGGRKTQ